MRTPLARDPNFVARAVLVACQEILRNP